MTGKKYKAALEAVDRDAHYAPADAVALVKKNATRKFDETVDIAVRLGVDPRKADQMVRGTVALPNGSGKTVRVAVFAAGEKATEAREAGADVVGAQDLADRIQKENFLDFDAAVATPDMMAVVGKVGKILGPRGLMPNPKTGTVTMDVGKAVSEIKGGKIEYKVDKSGNVHLLIGKASFSEQQLLENFQAVIDEIARAKPSAAKGKYIRSVTMSSTMGPGVKIDPDLKTGSTSKAEGAAPPVKATADDAAPAPAAAAPAAEAPAAAAPAAEAPAADAEAPAEENA